MEIHKNQPSFRRQHSLSFRLLVYRPFHYREKQLSSVSPRMLVRSQVSAREEGQNGIYEKIHDDDDDDNLSSVVCFVCRLLVWTNYFHSYHCNADLRGDDVWPVHRHHVLLSDVRYL